MERSIRVRARWRARLAWHESRLTPFVALAARHPVADWA
jgi:hypothetical protein